MRMMMRRWVAGVSASVVNNSSEREGGKERERQKASKRARERVGQSERKRYRERGLWVWVCAREVDERVRPFT